MEMQIDKSKIRKSNKLILEVEVEKVNSAGTIICSHHINITDNNIDCVRGIIVKPFDWEDVEQGMAFKTKDGNLVYFIANYPVDSNYIYATEKPLMCTGETVMTYDKEDLRRYPEEDVLYD